ncbi:hypothetical protein Tco_0857310 [Tanacetum coccineum]|uniref:Reverse transcriptase domain-containing protein n=1 Tax=Tanacetum coccineum TaxID=301880 RepID=A0ABQ5B6Z2_9ASTR
MPTMFLTRHAILLGNFLMTFERRARSDGFDYIFVSTKFMPLLNTQPSDLNYSYLIEMANVGMDGLSKLRAEIVCHEKEICIPLLNGEILKICGERSKENLKHLTSMKTDEKKLEDIPIVRDFPKVFLGDLTGLPPIRQTEFLIDLVHEATPVEKAPYR